MDFSKILDYQQTDLQLIKMEKRLSENDDKNIYTKMYNIVKQAQNQSAQLEVKAKNIVDELENIKTKYGDNVKSAKKVMNKKLETMTNEDYSIIDQISSAITENFADLEKRLSVLEESLAKVLKEFNEAKEKNRVAVQKFKHHKDLYDKEKEKLDPEIAKTKQVLTKLEKLVPENHIMIYKKLRQQNVVPVFVKVSDKCCGACRTEISSNNLLKLKSVGYVQCEHCRRINFE